MIRYIKVKVISLLIIASTAPVLLSAVEPAIIPDLDQHWSPYKVSWKTKTDSMQRDQFIGPIFEKRTYPEENYQALRPFYLETEFVEHPTDISHSTFLYPLFNSRKSKGHSQWSVLSLIRGSQIETVSDPILESGETLHYKDSFEIFPLYFDHDSWIPEYEYFGIMPFYGEVKNRIFYDRISWVAFPLYSEWEKHEEKTYAYLWPFIRYRTGPQSGGLSVWPLFGNFYKENNYHQRFALWPLIYYHQSKLYLDTPVTQIGVLPFYARETREGYIREDFIWPLFGYTNDSINQYQEVRYLWPLFIQGRGSNRYINQFAPFYSHSIRNGMDSKWYMWPLVKTQKYEMSGIDFEKFKLLYFLYQNTTQTVANRPDQHLGTKRHLWPLFSYWKDGNGSKQFQMFSPLEPLFQNNETIRRLYSPLFSIFKYQELNPMHIDMEILFSLIQFQKRPDHQLLEIGPFFGYESGDQQFRIDLLKGLLGYEDENGDKTFRLFWFDIALNSDATSEASNDDHE